MQHWVEAFVASGMDAPAAVAAATEHHRGLRVLELASEERQAEAEREERQAEREERQAARKERQAERNFQLRMRGLF